MSTIRIYKDSNLSHTTDLLFTTENPEKIRDRLADIGVRFEQWRTDKAITPGASQEEVIDAYRKDIDRLIAEDGYQTVDVVSLSADHPQKADMRKKFLSEHTHSEDEVRFFVAGEGLFTMHVGHEVYEVICKKGDLISVPANTPHWFDMGPNPNFVAIRLFNNPEGWVANFTGSDIATHFNRLDN
ncbi:MAG: acireductone dioxygenase [Pseudomonadota bacterium]|nr:acireductone dioxygenase [Pseudomonadota bacterium]